MTTNRYLVFSRVSDKSLHQEWLLPNKDKNFDLFLEYFGEQDKRYIQDCEYYSHNTTATKYIRLFDLVKNKQINIFDYDAVWLSDDDISTHATNINSMFKLFDENNLWLAQPALTIDSSIAHAITRVNPKYILRYTNFVEPMVPIFSKYALKLCLETFEKSVSGWGLDFVWPKLLGYPKDKIAIIDCLPVKHTRRGGTGDLYKNLKISPRQELINITNDYAVTPSWDFCEYGGILKEANNDK